MSFGQDLKDFTNAFVAGYNMVPSELDKKAKQAQIDAGEASATYQRAEAAAVPAREAYQTSQARYYNSRADWYDNGAPRTTTRINAPYGASGDMSWLDPSANPNNVPTIDVSGSSGSAGADTTGADNTGGVPGAPDASSYAPATPSSASPSLASPSSASPSSASPSSASPSAPAPTAAPQSLNALFNSADSSYGVPGYAQTVAGIETGGTFDPTVVNPKSGATGLFQFLPSTAHGVGLQDPTDPTASAQAFSKLTQQNQGILTKALGRPPTPAELYLAHQQGPMGAAALILHPNVPAAAVLATTYAQLGVPNPQQRAIAAVSLNGGTPNTTAGQFANKWIDVFNSRFPGSNGAGGSAPDASAYSAPSGTSQGNSALAAIDSAISPKPSASPQLPADSGAIPASATPSPTGYATGAMSAVGGAPMKAGPDAAGNRSSSSLDPNMLAAGIKAGQQAISDHLLPQGVGATPTAAQTAAVNSYHSGTGGNLNVLGIMRKKIDPQGKMNDGLVAALGIAQIMTMDRGTPQQKAMAIAELTQTMRLGFNQYATIANAAGQQGDLPKQLQAAAVAYNKIPNGFAVTHVGFDQGKNMYYLDVLNESTGQITEQPLMSPQDIAAGKLHIQPQMFDRMLGLSMSALNPPDKTPLTQNDQQAITDLQKTSKFDAGTYSTLSTAGRTAYGDAFTQLSKTTLTQNDQQAIADLQSTGKFDARAYSTLSTAGRTAYGDAFTQLSKQDAVKAGVAANSPTDADSVIKGVTDGLTTGPMANMQTPALQAVVSAFQDPKVAGGLRQTLIDTVKNGKGAVVPEELGRDIANLLVPGGMAFYDISSKKGDTTITNKGNGRTYSIPTPLFKTVMGIASNAQAKVQADESAALQGRQDAAARAKKWATPDKAAGGQVFSQLSGHTAGGPAAQVPLSGAVPISPPPGSPPSLGQRLQENLTRPGGIPITPMGN